jgi:hypothetical protein
MPSTKPGDDRRWMGVGRGHGADSRSAAMAAVRESCLGADPRLLVVFAAPAHNLQEVLAGLRHAAPGVPVAGCTTQGELGPGGPSDDTVTVAALGGPGFSVSVAVAEEVSGRQRESGVAVAQCAERVEPYPHRVLMLLTDGRIKDQETILRGVYSVVGAAIPLFGGASADGPQMTGGHVFTENRVMTDAVIAVTIASRGPLSVAARHGWRTVGEPMIVTSSGDGRVYTLDDAPAMDVYLDRLGAPPEAYTDADAFRIFSVARPLGVQRRSGVEARNISTNIDMRSRSVSSGTAIDHGGLIWAMDGDEASILDAAGAACRDALAGLGGEPALGLLTFSCAALRAILNDEGIKREGERIEEWAGAAPFAGFYTFGEIARVRGIDGFHNQTLAVLALG